MRSLSKIRELSRKCRFELAECEHWLNAADNLTRAHFEAAQKQLHKRLSSLYDEFEFTMLAIAQSKLARAALKRARNCKSLSGARRARRIAKAAHRLAKYARACAHCARTA